MKKFFCAALSAFVLLGAYAAHAAPSAEEIFVGYTPPAVEFTDMGDYPWAKEAVDYLTASGVTSGVGGGLFAPQRNVTRMEFIKMLCLACRVVNADAKSDYTDVPAEHWGYVYASSAKNIGILDIYGDGAIGADVFITREDMAYMAAKAMGGGTAEKGEKFSDDGLIADYAKDAVYYLRDIGVISGRGNGVFDPKGNASRAEAAKIIYSAAKEFEKNYLE